LHNYFHTGHRPQEKHSIYAPVGANMSFRRLLLEEVGGFDIKIKFGGDEMPIADYALKKFGPGSIINDPEILMLHDFDKMISDIFRRAFAYGRGAGATFIRTRKNVVIRPTATLQGSLLSATIFYDIFIGMSPLWLTSLVIVFPFITWRRALANGRRLGDRMLLPLVALLEEYATMAGFAYGALKARIDT
jgi:hypothetical protein